MYRSSSPVYIFTLLLVPWLALVTSLNLKIFRAEKTDLHSVAFLIASEKYKIKWPSLAESLSSESFLLVQAEHDRLLENYMKAVTSPRYLCVLKDVNVVSDDDIKPDNVIGYFDIDCSEECMNKYRNPTPYISDFAISPQWRQRGLGSYMLDCADQICVNEWGVNRMHLWVDTDNTAAVRLYSKSGFVPIFGFKATESSTDSEDTWGPLTEIVLPSTDEEENDEITVGEKCKSWAYDERFLASYRRVLARKLIT